MSNQYIDIEAFAHLSGLSVNTVRRKIKTLSETDKNAYIQYIPVVGRGGQKIMLDKALITQWTAMSNQEIAQNPVDESMSNQEKETIQEQIKEPEYDNSIIEILRGQIAIKDTQISDLSQVNKELLERLKEVNYILANVQKQLPTSIEQTVFKWWQFWK